MATLAESFLDDLDDLGSGSEEEEEDEEESTDKKFSRDLEDLENSDDNLEDENEITVDKSKEISPELQILIGKIRAGMSVDNIINIRNSNKFKKLIQDIDNCDSNINTQNSVTLEEDQDYKMILASNKIIQDINEEFENIHRFVAEKYSKKFPELESLVPIKLDYIRTVQRIGNELDMTLIDLNDILPSASVMVVSVTGSTSNSSPLPANEMEECLRGCHEIEMLEQDKAKILTFVESRMNKIAPNICILIGSRIAAQLIGVTGGLVSLSKIPSCNLQVVGQEKKYLSGFSKISALPHTGLLYYCDLVQNAPPFLRKKMLKIVAAKVTLAARVDSYKNQLNGEEGIKLRQEIEAKYENFLAPAQAKTKKALPIPEEKKRSKRGGKRVRRWKDRFAVTELRKRQNQMGFSSTHDEYGDSAMGLDTGLMGAKDLGKIRAPQEKKVKLLSNKQKAVSAGSSGQTNGLSSTLVFNNVQGMELINPNANADRVKAANDKWFNANSGFLSAAPSSMGKKDNGMVLK